jgi:hypothetical protein
MPKRSIINDDLVPEMRRLARQGNSRRDIAKILTVKLGQPVSKNVVIGKMWRKKNAEIFYM